MCVAAVSKTVSMENLDSIVAEVGRMEELLPITVHLSALLKKRNELIQKRAALPDSKTLMQDRSSGAEKRKKQAVRPQPSLKTPLTSRGEGRGWHTTWCLVAVRDSPFGSVHAPVQPGAAEQRDWRVLGCAVASRLHNIMSHERDTDMPTPRLPASIPVSLAERT